MAAKASRTPLLHPTTLICVNGKSAEIDLGLAPLIRLLWAAGIRTKACCERRRDGMAYILFEDLAQVRAFIRELGWFIQDGLLPNEATRADMGVLDGIAPWKWKYTLFFRDCFFELTNAAFYPADPDPSLPACPLVQISVEFPAGDIPVIKKRLESD